MYKYFKDNEFNRCNPPCSLSDMNSDFMARLDMARDVAKVPFVLSSAYRSVEYEKKHNRPGTSSHCLGLAVDIKCRSSFERVKIISSLISVGFRRIGISRNFIHVDLDTNKDYAIWLY